MNDANDKSAKNRGSGQTGGKKQWRTEPEHANQITIDHKLEIINSTSIESTSSLAERWCNEAAGAFVYSNNDGAFDTHLLVETS